ncbi:MAG: glycosyltransferase family 39 protein [Saprospiraceae bacterium]|nr:glycosyltransferase family 39 protein [Saprospiraceae bacterium]
MPKISYWIFLIGYLLLAWIYQYPRIMFELPQSLHQWRQADCLSLASNYQGGNDFFEPSVNYLGRDGTGKTMSEFPVIYYAVGKIWRDTGEQICIYRGLIAFIFFWGLLAVMRMVEEQLKNSWYAIFTALLMFTSPVLVYYSNNFLMNIPAFSFALIGLFFFFRYLKSPVAINFIFCCIFYTLAALLKASSLLSFIAVVLLLVLSHLRNNPLKINNVPLRRKAYLAIIGVFLIPLIWYRYAIWYNAQHTGGIFLIGTLPIWKMTSAQIQETLRHLFVQHLRWDYFRPFTEVAFLLFAIAIVPMWRAIERNLLILLVLISMGSVAFCLLFFGALQWHDYYVIDLFILVPILLMAFGSGLNHYFPRILSSVIGVVLMLGFLVHNADFARRRNLERYDINNYRNLHHRDIFQAFSEIEPLLKELHIGPEEKVISLSDYSINITLVLMHRKGWTDYGIGQNPDRINERIEQGARYLFVADKKTLENPVLAPYLKNKIGEYRNIMIYDLTGIIH